ncbi:YqaJ viral recombinase family protein [Kitasatospora sp. NPDC058046]|uniref:YqaJ viral recombinase family nuclease n=1 Tax=Kitasatospora sp. NPDC058046 TaxID=3346312 RepID=UPI0036D786E1
MTDQALFDLGDPSVMELIVPEVTVSPAPPLAAPTARLILPAGAPEEDWHAVRRAGIGGSDVAAILGLDKYRGPLHVYEAKHGRDLFTGNEATEIGSEIEDFVAGLFSKRSGMAVMDPPGTLVNVDRPWALANVDKFVLWDEETRAVAGPLELKNRSEHQAAEWEDGEIPDAPALQCHWYMAVGGWECGWVAALVGGNKLRWSRLERDEEMIGQLFEHCAAWYERHVLEGYPPEPGGLESTTELLAKLWSVKAETVGEVDVTEASALRARRAELKARAKAVGDELTAVENRMRQMAGEHSIVKADGKPAWTWKANGNFAPKQFTEAHPELAAQYTRMVPAIDTDLLKVEQPDIYAQFRARRLVVPAKGV